MGLTVLSEWDTNADGVADQINTYEYNAYGNRTREERDNDANGSPDIIHVNQFDPDGNLMRHERDDDGDGTPELIRTYGHALSSWAGWVAVD